MELATCWKCDGDGMGPDWRNANCPQCHGSGKTMFEADVAYQRISNAVEEHQPVAVFALCSGGHDSLTVSNIASSHPALTAVVHINTGIGIEEGRQHLRQIVKDRGWPFIEYSHELGNHPGPTFEELIDMYGFPGPANHQVAYDRLKDRALRALIRDHKTKWSDKILLLTGVRSVESARRMGNVEPIQVDGAKVWTAIIHDWTDQDKNLYMEREQIPRNPVNDKLHYSGECLCGAFARPGEIEELKFWYPEVAERIHQLEHDIKDKNPGAAVWGQAPAKSGKLQQSFPMCTHCDNWKREGHS